MRIRNGQKMHPNYNSVNVCISCRRTNLHYDAIQAGYKQCPECLDRHYKQNNL